MSEEPKPKLAYEVDVFGCRCVVFATSFPAAKWIAVKSGWNAGFGRRGSWPTTKAKRLPHLDNSELKAQPAKAWVPEYAEGSKPI